MNEAIETLTAKMIEVRKQSMIAYETEDEIDAHNIKVRFQRDVTPIQSIAFLDAKSALETKLATARTAWQSAKAEALKLISAMSAEDIQAAKTEANKRLMKISAWQ